MSGLDLVEVERRQGHFGPNAVTVQRGTGVLVRLLLQFHQPLIYILIAAGLTKGLLGDLVDAGVIFGVVLVNAVIGFVQEEKASAGSDPTSSTTSSSAR